VLDSWDFCDFPPCCFGFVLIDWCDGFCREDFRKDYKEKHPNVKQVSVIGKAGGDKWKSLSEAEKAPFVSKAEKLKAEYNKKMDAYNNKPTGGPTASGDSDKSRSEVNDEDEEADE
jgi:high mobility group protein B3